MLIYNYITPGLNTFSGSLLFLDKDKTLSWPMQLICPPASICAMLHLYCLCFSFLIFVILLPAPGPLHMLFSLPGKPFCSLRGQLSNTFLREAFTGLPKANPPVTGFQSNILLLCFTCHGCNFTFVLG